MTERKASIIKKLSNTLHPENAEDKVLSGIVKALNNLKNNASSPKEIANTVIDNNYAQLG
jgi:hypothetical protein